MTESDSDLNHLLDTNILLRVVRHDAPERPMINRAVERLAMSGARLCFVPQSIVEM